MIGSRLQPLFYLIASSTLVLFGLSSLRHGLFLSNAFDLGWFDQALYLISQNQNPVVSFAGFHVLGDHAALILYPLALLYKLYPDVHWLFAVQALSLSSGVWPLWQLATDAKLKHAQIYAVAIAYLLYPALINSSLYDFHPEVLAIPAIFAAVLAAKRQAYLPFVGCLLWILSCKAVLSLTVVAMGLWLGLTQRRRYGLTAMIMGGIWFGIATQVLIPAFNPAGVAAVNRYAEFGHTPWEILRGLLLNPALTVQHLFTGLNLEYVILLVLPLIWGLRLPYLAPLISALPTLVINLLTDYPGQKNLIHQYSLPILPFLILGVIQYLGSEKARFSKPSWIMAWGSIWAIALSKRVWETLAVALVALQFWAFPGMASGMAQSQPSDTVQSMRTWQTCYEAMAQIPSSSGRILVPTYLAPHLTHRPEVKLTNDSALTLDLNTVDYAILNLQYPGWASSVEMMETLKTRFSSSKAFKLSFQKNGVYVFQK